LKPKDEMVGAKLHQIVNPLPPDEIISFFLASINFEMIPYCGKVNHPQKKNPYSWAGFVNLNSTNLISLSGKLAPS
jgi:hypothetical protein